MDQETLIEELQADLLAAQQEVHKLKAQMASRLAHAFDNLPEAAKFMGSGVIVTIEELGGKQIVSPFCIRDGISQVSVEALQEDVRRSFEIATMVNPAMARMKS